MDSGFSGSERFQVLRRLGGGGMGVVWEVLDRQSETRVALKTLTLDSAASLYQFKREFRFLADLVHPNLVQLYEFFSEEGTSYFTMELIAGGQSLSEYLRRSTRSIQPRPQVDRLPETISGTAETLLGGEEPTIRLEQMPPACDPDRLRKALRQLSQGLSFLHAANRLHRDIKPSNVMVTTDGRVVLLDFGLVTHAQMDPFDKRTQNLFAGTIAYMSPEQAASQPLTEASDWYSLGLVAYEALVGELPFQGDTAKVLIDRQQIEPPPPSLHVDAPPDLDELIQGLLRLHPEDRWTSSQIIEQLGEGAEAIASPGTPSQADKPRLLGRAAELERLERAFEKSLQGESVVVFVHGTSGMGKSALVGQFLSDRLLKQDAVVIQGRCYEQESLPFKTVDSLIDSLSGYLCSLPQTKADSLMPRDIGALVQVFPVLQRVPSVAAAPRRPHAPLNQAEVRRRAFRALREMLARLGDRRRLVLFIDDLQWGDVDGVLVLREITRPPDPPALMLIGAYRTEDIDRSPCLRALLDPPEAAEPLAQTRIEVGPLDAADTRELVKILVGSKGTPGESKRSNIVRESLGNPYFVRLLSQELREEHLEDEPSEVTLESVLMSRIDRLSPAARAILEVVSVAGRPLSTEAAVQAAGLAEFDPSVMGLLRSGHFIRSSSGGNQKAIESYHDRVRETLLAHLDPATRKRHHCSLADTLEAATPEDAEVLATHFEGCDRFDQAAHYYSIAARQASQGLAFAHAAGLFHKALQLRPLEGADALEMRSQLAEALENAGRCVEAAEAYLSAASVADSWKALELQHRAAYQYCISGYVDESLAIFRQVLGRFGLRLANRPFRAVLSFLVVRLQLRLMGLNFRPRAVADIPRAELAKTDAVWSAGVGLGLIYLPEGSHYTARSLLLALQTGEPYRICRALPWEAATTASHNQAGKRRGEKLLSFCRKLVEEHPSPHARGMLALGEGVFDFTVCRFAESTPKLKQAEEILSLECKGANWELSNVRLFQMFSLLFRGLWKELFELSRPLLQSSLERGDLYSATAMGVNFEPLWVLCKDQPERCRDLARHYLSQWSQRTYYQQHVMALQTVSWSFLYEGKGGEGFEHLLGEWPKLRRNLYLWNEWWGVTFTDLRGRLAAAAAAESGDLKPWSKEIDQAIRKLERSRLPTARVFQPVLEAGKQTLLGQTEAALQSLERAEQACSELDMGIHLAAVRFRRGQVLGGDEGRLLMQRAGEWMNEQDVQRPELICRMLAPGATTRPEAAAD